MFGEHTHYPPAHRTGRFELSPRINYNNANAITGKTNVVMHNNTARGEEPVCIIVQRAYLSCLFSLSALCRPRTSLRHRVGGGGGFRNSQIRHGISPYGVHTTRSRSVAAREIRIRNARLQFNGPESADRFIGPCHRISHDSQTIFQSSRLTVDRNRNTPVPSRPELDFGVRLGLVILYL